jgi:hypothetical protein
MTEEKKYKNKVVFLHKSTKGKHLYAFNKDGAFATANVILMNISDVEALIAGEYNSIKVSILEKEDDLSG